MQRRTRGFQVQGGRQTTYLWPQVEPEMGWELSFNHHTRRRLELAVQGKLRLRRVTPAYLLERPNAIKQDLLVRGCPRPPRPFPRH